MANDKPLMPKATAVWLVNNTSLTFEQIAEFCGLHPLEVKGIADGEVAKDIRGLDPVATGQLTREQIELAQKDPSRKLKMVAPSVVVAAKPRRGPRYTPVSKRQDRPDAILWLLRNHSELTDAQIVKLVGTTKATIETIRNRGHWNAANLKPVDPVTLGLCTQLDLDLAVQKANDAKNRATRRESGGPRATLRPASETAGALNAGVAEAEDEERPAEGVDDGA